MLFRRAYSDGSWSWQRASLNRQDCLWTLWCQSLCTWERSESVRLYTSLEWSERSSEALGNTPYIGNLYSIWRHCSRFGHVATILFFHYFLDLCKSCSCSRSFTCPSESLYRQLASWGFGRVVWTRGFHLCHGESAFHRLLWTGPGCVSRLWDALWRLRI